MAPIPKRPIARQPSEAVSAGTYGVPRVTVLKSPADREDIADLLGSLPDRPDLERLFDRHVDVPTLLRLMARQVSRRQVLALLESDQFDRDLRLLLD